MAHMRRLHGEPATAPAGDLADADYDAADVALGSEGEGLDGDPVLKRQEKKDFPPCNLLICKGQKKLF